MKRILHRRPSASMLVAITALVVASGGTALAAGLVNGDKLIKKNSLSGNRLRNHTVTGTQVNLKKLGKVPSAVNADHATTATSATSAGSASAATVATAALTANNATNLAGFPASAYEPSAHFIRTGLVTATSGQTVTLATFGPFTLKLNCVAGTGSAVGGEIDATSTVANSDGYGTAMTTAGTSYSVLTSGPTTSPNENDDDAADFFTPAGATYIADLTVGENEMGLTGKCYANALVSPS
jgi:hypothetical protein